MLRPYRHQSLWHGCVGAWCPSQAHSGATLIDYSNRNNHGALTNMDPATDWVTSGGGWALDFDGNNDTVVTNSPFGADGNQQPAYAMSLWFKAPTSTTVRIFACWRNSQGLVLELRTVSRLFTRHQAWTYTPDDTWTHLVLTSLGFHAPSYVNGDEKIYINGNLLTTYDPIGAAAVNNSNTTINISGRNGTGSFAFLGQMDDLRFCNRLS